jgi:hypothetical protein
MSEAVEVPLAAFQAIEHELTCGPIDDRHKDGRSSASMRSMPSSRRGRVRSGNRSAKVADAACDGELVAEDGIEYGDLDKEYQQSTIASHFVEVDSFTGETRIRRMRCAWRVAS